MNSTRSITQQLSEYIARIPSLYNMLPSARKELLEIIASKLGEKYSEEGKLKLLFICTHNSRRSHMAQIWASVAAYHYSVAEVDTYSGGTERTAFHSNAIAAFRRAGFLIEAEEGGDNPVCMVYFSEESPPVKAFSSRYDDPENPTSNFIAFMTCSDADEACPVISGSAFRFSIPYEDPKLADGTREEARVYDERCLQIAVEMFFLFQRISENIE